MYTEYMYNDSLTHYGILGMKWGVRRYQNTDGSLTAEGRKRYSQLSEKDIKKTVKTVEKISKDRWSVHTPKDYEIQESLKRKLQGKISLESIQQKKKELNNFQKENADYLKKARDDIYNKSSDWKNIDKEVNVIAAKKGIKKNEIEDNIEWLQDEARSSLESRYEKEYEKTDLGNKEKQLIDSLMNEYEKVGKAAVGDYGNIQLKNVYTWKNGQRQQAHLEDVINNLVRELDKDLERAASKRKE